MHFRGQGKFFDDHVNFAESQYDTIRTVGSSTLTKALAMPLDELRDLIEWSKNGKSNAEIVDRVESYPVRSLQWVSDATYGMRLSFEYFFSLTL